MALQRVEIEVKHGSLMVTSTFEGKHPGMTVRTGGRLAALFFAAESMNAELFAATLARTPALRKVAALLSTPETKATTEVCMKACVEVAKQLTEGRFRRNAKVWRLAANLITLAHEEANGSSPVTDLVLMHDLAKGPSD